MTRALGLGIGSAAGLLWLTFFATAAAVQVATLGAVVGSVIWLVTVDRARLLDEHGRPHLLLVWLTLLAVSLLLTAAVVVRTGTVFLIASIGVLGAGAGMVRALRGWAEPGREE